LSPRFDAGALPAGSYLLLLALGSADAELSSLRSRSRNQVDGGEHWQAACLFPPDQWTRVWI